MTDKQQAQTAAKTKKASRGLGRGLEALFEDEEGVYPQADPQGQTPGTQRHMAGLDQLEPGPFQPRRHMNHESIAELAASIKEHGVLQPILVRAKPGTNPDDKQFEIIAGERRWRAAQSAQLHEVPIIIGDFEDQVALEIGLIENLQREDLNALDEADGYKRLADEFGHTQEKIATKLGKSRSHVANMMRLLTLPDDVKTLLKRGKLSAGHARAMVGLNESDASDMAHYIIEEKLTVREAEELAAMGRGEGTTGDAAKGKGKSGGAIPKDVDTIALEEEIGNRLGMKIAISMKKGGGGAMKIGFKTLDQLDEVLRRLSHNPERDMEE